MLNSESNLAEVLWNFTRFKPEDKRRLTLKQNPHFYKFPDSPQYDGEFRLDPIDNFQHTQISVITDKPSRVFVKTPQRTWAFGNFWRVPYNNDDNPIIFKGSSVALPFPSSLPSLDIASYYYDRRLWKA